MKSNIQGWNPHTLHRAESTDTRARRTRFVAGRMAESARLDLGIVIVSDLPEAIAARLSAERSRQPGRLIACFRQQIFAALQWLCLACLRLDDTSFTV